MAIKPWRILNSSGDLLGEGYYFHQAYTMAIEIAVLANTTLMVLDDDKHIVIGK